jgi:hypothetical protein
MKEPISSGRKLTWNETFIWIPLAKFLGNVVAYAIIIAILFIVFYIGIKLVKFIWFL